MSALNASVQQPVSAEPEPRSTEPSMEDILASIRRIIADDQSKHPGSSLKRGTPVPLPTPMEPAAAPDEAAPPHDGAGSEQAHPVEEPEHSSASSLVEAAPIEEDAGSASGPEEMASSFGAPPEPSAEVAFDHFVEPALIDEIAQAGAASILRPAMPEPVPSSAARESAPGVIESEPAPDLGRALHAERWMPEAPEPLISPTAGASIEHSFNSLATSVFLQNNEMIEGVVRELLRPMLKTWLDDNLPTIVERLVRLEIERVARGGKPARH